MNRRTFLHHTCHSLALPGLLGSFGFASPDKLASFLKTASDTDRVLVLIYLQGGNDGLNTVVPLDQLSALNTVRPHVVIPQNKLLTLSGTSLALHPSLGGLKSLYQEGRLEIIQSVGYPDQNYSHFRSTDIWMSGSAPSEFVNSGWAGRYLSHQYPDYPQGYPNTTNPHPLAVEMGYGASLLLQGPAANMSMVINNPDEFYQLVDNIDESFPDTDAGNKLKYISRVAAQSQLYGKVVKQVASQVTDQKPYPDEDLARQLKIVSRLIAGGLKTSMYLVRLSGFDTHDAQVESSDHTQGRHALLLKKLNDAIMAFMSDLKYHNVDDRVVGMTFSEFGRRIVSNASIGTDHGSASPLFVFGNKVKGGVLGTNPHISPSATYKDNLDVQFNFRQVYTSILEQWFNVPATDASSIILSPFETVPVIESSVVSGINEQRDTGTKVYPNPVESTMTVEFMSTASATSLDIIDMQGRHVKQIYQGTPAFGKQRIQCNLESLPPGEYFLLLRGNDRRETKSILKLR